MFQFNVRVYGILINANKAVLLSDECIRGKHYTKFPGGGLEFGEGTKACLRREFLEEMQLDVVVQDHFYTTDFFQVSAFNPKHQIISVYYFVQSAQPFHAPESVLPLYVEEDKLAGSNTERFRFVPWNSLSEASVSLPIDKAVVRLLKTQ